MWPRVLPWLSFEPRLYLLLFFLIVVYYSVTSLINVKSHTSCCYMGSYFHTFFGTLFLASMARFFAKHSNPFLSQILNNFSWFFHCPRNPTLSPHTTRLIPAFAPLVSQPAFLLCLVSFLIFSVTTFLLVFMTNKFLVSSTPILLSHILGLKASIYH